MANTRLREWVFEWDCDIAVDRESFESKLQAGIAQAEMRATEKLLLYGFSNKYAAKTGQVAGQPGPSA